MAQGDEANGAAAAEPPPPLRLSRVFRARRVTVFEAWSSAAHVRRWFSPETFTVADAKVEMHVGGAFDVCMRSPGGADGWIRGTFIEVAPHTRLVIDMQVASAAGAKLFQARTEVDFSDAPGGTRIDLVQTYTLIDPSVAGPMVAGALEGWRTTLDKLEAEVLRADGEPGRSVTSRIAPFLWFDGDAEAAAQFYARVFPDSHVGKVRRAPGGHPAGEAGKALTVEFTVLGMAFVGLNGGPMFTFNEAVSFQVYAEDQAETDRYWDAITADGGQAGRCGWCKDKFGLSWQVVPRRLLELVAGPDGDRARRATDAMMRMRKIDVAALERAAAGETTPP